MRIITLTLFLSLSMLCKAQQLNTEITNENDAPYLLGKIDKSGLESANYKSWFTKNHDTYQPNSELINTIASELKTYSITLFMGTWCSDSQQEVPKLYKVLEACNFPMDQLSVIAVSEKPNMYKQSPQHEEAGLNIHRVPTVIFYKDGKEVNRIVEHPVTTFEEDIQNIITTNTYKSNYNIVKIIDDILKDKGVKGFKKKQNKLLKIYEGKVTSLFELNTYGRILYGTNRISDAIAVFEFNTKLFPNDPRTYTRLANILNLTSNKPEAIKVLEKALKTLPNHKDLKENLELIKSN